MYKIFKNIDAKDHAEFPFLGAIKELKIFPMNR
jgi:hypothetical protein